MIYESCIILDPQLDEEARTAAIDKIKGALTEAGAEFVNESLWGMRKLAYPIQKKNDGFYVVLFYRLPKVGETLVTLERNCKYDDNIFRIMTVTVPENVLNVAVCSPSPWLWSVALPSSLARTGAAAENTSSHASETMAKDRVFECMAASSEGRPYPKIGPSSGGFHGDRRKARFVSVFTL